MQVLCDCKDDVKYPKKNETLCVKSNDFATKKLKKTNYAHHFSKKVVQKFHQDVISDKFNDITFVRFSKT